MKKTRRELRKTRKKRVRVAGTKDVPRLSVFRGNKKVFVQLIDDEKGVSLRGILSQSAGKIGGKIKASFEAGETLAEEAKKLEIKRAVFDRGGYKFHGRVKAVKEGAEKGGLIFKNNNL